MGFHVDYSELDQLYADVYGNVSAWNNCIATLSDNAKRLVSSSNMVGIGAENVKLYFDSVHNTIIPVLSRLLLAHLNNCLLYVRNYQSGIDTALHSIIDEGELRHIKRELSAQEESSEMIDVTVQNTLKTVSDIVAVPCTGFLDIIDSSAGIQKLIERLLANINELENNHYQNDFDDTTQLISALSAFIAEHLRDSRSYKSNFSVESLTQSSAFVSLSQAYVSVNKQIEANQEAVTRAIEEENSRIEALNTEREERQKEANREKWIVTGLCLVGSVVAVVAIVGSGGTATPLVVGSVSAVSGAVIAGNNAAADEYIEHGWDTRKWDKENIGTSAVLGGVSGFVTGYVGAGISGTITEGMSAAGSTLLNSSSTVVRVGSNAVIGSTSQVVSGVATRSTSTFITTMITSEGDIETSVDAAWKSVTDGQQILIDAAIGGVAGGIKGIKKPVNTSPIRSESDIIDDGPYIKDGKPNGRPTLSGEEKLKFEEEIYECQIANSKDGLLHDPNTGEIIDWKPGEPRKGVVDFGHKTGLEYADMFEKYKYGEISVEELKEFQFNPDNYQLEAPSINRSHMYEASESFYYNSGSHNTESILSATRVAREDGIKGGRE